MFGDRVTPSVLFSFGNIFQNSSALFLSRAGLFVAIAILLNLPLLAVSLSYPAFHLNLDGTPEIVPENTILYIFLSLVTQGVLSAVAVYVVVMQLRGRFVSFGEALMHGLSRILSAILTSFVSALCIGAGAFLFLIPGLILLVWLFVAIPASVVERRWPINSLGRSRFLTEGHRWTLFGIIAVYGIASIILDQLVGLVVQTSGLPMTQVTEMEALAETFLGATLVAYYSVLQSYVYCLLVIEKDGVDIETVARVFD